MMKSLMTGLSVMAAANFAFAAATTTSVDAGETTAKIEDVKEVEKRWSASLFQETFIGQGDFRYQDRSAAAGTDMAVGLSYKVNDNVALHAKQWATLNQTRDDQEGEFDTLYMQLSRTNAKAYKLGSRDVSSDVRLNVPTGEYMREIGRWEARYGVGMSQEINSKLSVSYAASVRGYTYTVENDGSNWMRYYLGSTASYKANDFVAPFADLTYEGRQYHTGEGFATMDVTGGFGNPTNARDTFFISAGANFTAGPIGIGVYTKQSHRLQNNNEFNLFESGETEYLVNMAASL